LLKDQQHLIASVAGFSGVINVLALSGSLYMLQVYDRVLPSQSVPTLIGLSVLLLLLYVINGGLEFIRSRIMARIGTRLDVALSPRVFKVVQLLTLRNGAAGNGMQPLRDLDSVRNFVSGPGPQALFDLPWIPVYLLFVYFLHPVLALIAVGGALLLIALAFLTEYRSAGPLRAASQSGSERMALAEAARRNAETLTAMGYDAYIRQRFTRLNEEHIAHQLAASDAAAGIGSISKCIRMILQSSVLGVGAYLVIQNELSAGAIIAASITVSRSLAPIDTAIAQWKNFVSCRQAARRLGTLLLTAPEEEERIVDLPAPRERLDVAHLVIAPPGNGEPILKDVSFSLDAGDALGVIGASGSGKSTLARAIVGIWTPSAIESSVRLDGATLDQWSPEKLGRHVGYMPQDIELMTGTVAENISRFIPGATDEQIIAAAKTAGAHDVIVRLPQGYQTLIGDGGRVLSGGERQRIALARALYGDPFLVVLDEPNANLDANGDASLADAVASVRKRGGIAVVIAHRPSALASVNKVLLLSSGKVRAFGSKEEILRNALQPVPSVAANDVRHVPHQQPAAMG
jgi:ATP-binding cassette subfamily C protein